MAEALEGVVKRHLSTLQLSEGCYSHIAGILTDDASPKNGAELNDMIGDFIRDGCGLSEAEIKSQVTAMLSEVEELGLSSSGQFGNFVVAVPPPQPVKQSPTPAPVASSRPSKAKPSRKAPKRKTKKRQDYEDDSDLTEKPVPQVRIYRPQGEEAETRLQDIVVDSFNLIIGGKVLIENAQLKLSCGHKYGLIGRNGIGKTTLLRALATCSIEKQPKGMNILYVEQEVEPSPLTALEALLETDVERTDLLAQEKAAEAANDTDALQIIYERLEEIESSTAESRASTILAGLGFSEVFMHRPLLQLSGGWRRRVALARALYVKPDFLFLDEPTNHLDLETVIWLENFLKTWTGTLLLVSHARDFLNQVITDVVHLFNHQLEYYRGNYDDFEKNRNERLLNQRRASSAQKKKVDHIQEFVNRFRCNAKRASLVQSRIKAINKMEIIEDVLDDPLCSFLFVPPEEVTPPLLRIDDGVFSYPNCDPLLRAINFGLDSNSRIALLGRNGEGKSTLLKLLIGSLELSAGNQIRNRRIRVSMFAQHQTDELDLTISALQHLSLNFPSQSAESLRAHLSSFGLMSDLALLPMNLLSGGQKARVAFATAAFYRPHVMLLDEPTNHLDLDAVQALIIALHAFTVSFSQGGLVVVSHDMHFIQSLCEELWVIGEGRVKRFRGDAIDYRRSLN